MGFYADIYLEAELEQAIYAAEERAAGSHFDRSVPISRPSRPVPKGEVIARRRRGADFPATIVNEKQEPRKRTRRREFPEPGAIDELFREARRNRA